MIWSLSLGGGIWAVQVWALGGVFWCCVVGKVTFIVPLSTQLYNWGNPSVCAKFVKKLAKGACILWLLRDKIVVVNHQVPKIGMEMYFLAISRLWILELQTAFVKLVCRISTRYHRVKRKAEKRAAGKIAGEDTNENAEEALEKAERLRAMVRSYLSLCHWSGVYFF